jgi:hypothetical protein
MTIVPDDVVLVGTIRSFKPEVRAKMFDAKALTS